MKGKTVVITGANSGIGKSTAMALAKQGAHIVMVCRNEDKGYAAQQDIIATSKNEAVELYLCDFSEQRQIKGLVEELEVGLDKIDVLLNNAGLIMNKRALTIDGLETTFAVNHMGYFMLTNLLLDMVTATPQSRIICVASDAHRMVKSLDFDNLQAEKKFSQWQVYGLSKLCNIYFTYELAKRLKDSSTTVNCLHPGVVGTNFGKEGGGWLMGGFMSVFKGALLSPEKGAETSIYLANSPEVEGVSGKYFNKKKATKSSDLSNNGNYAERLWSISEDLMMS